MRSERSVLGIVVGDGMGNRYRVLRRRGGWDGTDGKVHRRKGHLIRNG